MHFLTFSLLKQKQTCPSIAIKVNSISPQPLLHTKPLSLRISKNNKKKERRRKTKKIKRMDSRKPYFIEEAEMDAVVSTPCYKNMNQYHPQNYYNYHQNSPRSAVVPGKFHYYRADNSYFGQQSLPHFLDSCSLCKKRLGNNRDIFMYRYIPFLFLLYLISIICIRLVRFRYFLVNDRRNPDS